MKLMTLFFEKNICSWIIGFALVALAICQGAYDFITVDTLYKIEISKMMLNGKMIYKDLFEVNHPMPTYIIWIAVYIASKIAWLSDVFATKALISMLCLLSVILTHMVMTLSDEYEDKYFRFTFIIILCYITFLLPIHRTSYAEIGQKSHFFIILFLPYLHSFILTDKQRKQRPYLMFIIGILAGIGLCVKIYFFIIAAILEIYRACNQKSFSSFFRIESFAIAFVAISFLLSILIFTPEYITQVIPMASVGYVGYAIASHKSWCYYLLSVFPCFILLLFFVKIKSKTPKYSLLLKVAIVASIIAIMPQVTNWGYTALPIFALIMLFAAMIASNILRQLVEDFPREKGQQFTKTYVLSFASLLFTVTYIIQVLTTNITAYSTKKQNSYDANQVDYFIDLSKKYGDKGGAHFLTESFSPGIYSWIYGDFSLQSYFYSAYMIDGLFQYKLFYQGQGFPGRMQGKEGLIEDEIRSRMVEDIIKQEPAIIVVHKGKLRRDEDEEDRYFVPPKVNYIEFLKEDSRFKEMWKKYTLKEVVQYQEEEEGRIDPKSLLILSVYIKKTLEE